MPGTRELTAPGVRGDDASVSFESERNDSVNLGRVS